MKFQKRAISILFLALFGLIQILESHAFAHETGDQECQICKISSENPNDTLWITETIQLEEIQLVPIPRSVVTYKEELYLSTEKFLYNNKAPPVIS